jgi:hypothetical protein
MVQGFMPDHAKKRRERQLKFLRRGQNMGCPVQEFLNAWFDKHDMIIPRQGSEAGAFLSCMFPECRADQVYNLQEAKLEAIV